MATLERLGVVNETVTSLNPQALGLVASESEIVDIATELAYNRTVTSVNLSGCPMSLEAATALARTLGERNRNVVQHLKLSGCGLNAETIAPLAAALGANSRIEILDLANNPIRDEGAVHLGKMLEANATLRTVDFGQCKIGPSGVAALGGALTVNQRLKTLTLSNNKLREAGILALCRGMEKNESVAVLNVSGNSINREGGLGLAQLLKKNKILESLDLGKNFLSDSIPFILSAMCERGTPARLLDISNNRITNEICKTMAQVLEGHKFAIACLSVEKNPIEDDGLVALFHALKGTNLQFLDLSETSLTSHSGVVIADLITACPMLNSLQIDGNVLGDEAIVEIATALGKSRSLSSVNFERTALGPIGCAAIAEAVKKIKRVRSLTVAENKRLAVGDILQLLDALAVAHSLEDLDMGDMEIADSEDVLRALIGVFVENPRLPRINLEHNPISNGMPGGVMTREDAMSLVDEASLHPGVNKTESAVTVSKLQSGTLVDTSAGHISKLMNTTFRPKWATTVPMEHQELMGGAAEDEAEEGSKPPLVPHPNSLHHPLYPGYGKGRFSNGNLLQTLNNPLPYNIAVSHGERPPFRRECDGSAEVATAPRRPMKFSPYSLISLETNLGQLPITEDQLKRKFAELDVDGNGYLDREEFKQIYLTFQSFGLTVNEKEVEELMKRYSMWSDNKVTFDEFSILMLKLATR